MRSTTLMLALLSSLAGAGCNVLPIPISGSRSSIPDGESGRFSSPKNVVILPPSVDVFRKSDGAGRRSERRSQEAAAYIAEALRARLVDSSFELHELPDLDEAHRARIREHVGLCGVVAPLAAARAPISGCKHTLGQGLAFLTETNAVEAAWIANGVEIGKSVDGESGPSAMLAVSLVDLRSGDLLWVAQAGRSNRFHPPSLGSEDDVARLVGELLRRYPDSETTGQRSATAARGSE
jgi:hypothetical protein